MKIRCESDSIRLRLRKSEISHIRAEQQLSTAVRFPDGGEFSWTLLIDAHAKALTAAFQSGKLSVHIPLEMAMQWIDSEQVGLETGQGSIPHILIEKDFPCKDRPDEDKADFFEELAEKEPPAC
jgi:hypothetical protein